MPDPILTVAVSPYITAQGEPIRRDGDAATVRVGPNQTATGKVVERVAPCARG